jgi:hypothetical protein
MKKKKKTDTDSPKKKGENDEPKVKKFMLRKKIHVDKHGFELVEPSPRSVERSAKPISKKNINGKEIHLNSPKKGPNRMISKKGSLMDVTEMSAKSKTRLKMMSRGSTK